MDKTIRLDALKQLDSGAITVTQAMERFGGSERHWRRLLSTYRKPKGDVTAKSVIDGGPIFPKVSGHPTGAAPKPPEVRPIPGAAPVPPSMADIDKALAGGGVAADAKGPDPALTADMALQGIRMAKMLAVASAAELMGVKDEKAILKLCALQPVTETIIRMQKPEAWAKLGEMGSDPRVLIGVLIADTMLAGWALFRMMPKKEEADNEGRA